MTSEAVLEIFKKITTIPRESGHEGPITSFLVQWAADHGLMCKTDPTGNVNIIREASQGREHIPALVLQCHQDMVCEKKAGVQFDFSKDPINFVIEDGWMIAKDTTLGADDGIGIAACLALLESPLPTGKLECVFTISEETGMDGAEAMEEGFFSGKTLINLDSEDEGQLFIGCAGGVNTIATFSYGTEPVKPGFTCVRLAIDGAQGGHSGDDINKMRANAVQQMARFLFKERKHGLQLLDINGGNKSNAIARDCAALVAVSDPEATVARFRQFGADLKAEFAVSDPGVSVSASPVACTSQAVKARAAGRIISALAACPHGVEAMSQDIEGLVETSTNLAAIRFEDGKAVVTTSQRSSIMSARDMMASKIEALFTLAGAKVEHKFPYPGWKPDVNSHILRLCTDSYKRLFGTDPLVKAIHAGLECGLFLEKFPGLDMISFGPTLRGVHAPGEKMELASLDKFVALLEDVVCQFR